MNLDLASLFPDLEALTPDGRWNMLQDWLSKNPEYGEKVDRWSQMTVDAVCDEITVLVIGKYGGIAVFVLQSEVGRTIKEKVKRWIEVLQACYRERANHDNKNNDNSKPASRRRKGKLHAETKKAN